jgi:methyl coenzyme M reductase subunit C
VLTRQAGFPDDGSKSAFRNFLLIGDGDPTEGRIVMPRDHVTAGLVVDLIAGLPKGS